MKIHALTAEEDRARLVLRHVMGYRGMTGAELGRRVGVTRETVSAKMKGSSILSISDLHRFAEALDIEPQVFFLEPDDAVRWVLDNAPTFARQGGMAELPLVITVLASAIAAWVGVKAPELAMWFAENQRTDEVMSDSTASGRPRTSCPASPTRGAKSVCRPRTHRPSRPDHRVCMRRGLADAAECVDPR